MGQTDTTATRPFRAGDWWTSKASLLMGFVYLFALWFQIPLMRFVPLAALSVVVIAGFASFGYLVNDYYDQDKDRLADKRNFLLDKPLYHQLGLAIISLLCISLPWLYLPATRVSYILIGGQLILFIIYSCPPLRLKERGLAGIVTDALYAHALPVILAAYTFLLASSLMVPYAAFVLLFVWQLLSGMRNILVHQTEDRTADTVSGTQTYVTSVTPARVALLVRIILSSELLLCTSFFAVLTRDHHTLSCCLITVVIYGTAGLRQYMRAVGGKMPAPPLRYLPNRLYEMWLPVVYLMLLTYADPYYALLLALHVGLFGFGAYVRAVRTFTISTFYHIQNAVLIPIRRLLSAVANYAIYHSLRAFGIDLKKEHVSALGYFKKKRGIHK